MKITKHGKFTEKDKGEEFTCLNCGCKFTCDKDEYHVESNNWFSNGDNTLTYSATVNDIYVCSCPECHKIVRKNKARLNGSITVTGDGDNYKNDCATYASSKDLVTPTTTLKGATA